jgi:hypothetical protein
MKVTEETRRSIAMRVFSVRANRPRVVTVLALEAKFASILGDSAQHRKKRRGEIRAVLKPMDARSVPAVRPAEQREDQQQ